MAWDAGFNFRGTSGYATDGANTYPVLAEAYSHTYAAGVVAGWSTAPSGALDRNSGLDNRLRGINWTSSLAVFRVDLPAAGDYKIWLAMGDGDVAGNQTGVSVVVKDNTTTKFTIGSHSTTAQNFYNANDVNRTAADWVTNYASDYRTVTFASTTLNLELNGSLGVLAHLFISQVVAGGGGGGGGIAATEKIELKLNGVWTDVTADVGGAEGEGISGGWGIGGNGPTDRLADLGILTFTLNNSTTNSAHLAGYYSPAHANCRAGFQHGVLCRRTCTYLGTGYPRFYGKVFNIDPAPGSLKSRRTQVIVHDLMDDLIETDLRNVTLQVNQTEAQLIATIVAALPAAAQPVSSSLDSGLDTSPFAFDTLGPGQKAIAPLADIAISAVGYIYMKPDGVLRYENRQARQLKTSSFTLANDMIDLVVPTSLEGVYNHIRATFHPRIVDAAATTVLWSQTGTPPSIGPAQTIEIWGDYYKATEPSVLIGGTAQVTPAATTDYLANTLADGTGTNKTANITVVATFFASTVKFVITNNDAGTVFLTKLQARGKGLYDLSPVTVESTSTQFYGDRVINIDLPYQTNFNVTQDLADYIRSQYETLGTQAQSVTFNANRSGAFMLAAMTAQIGDRITISEAQTGLTTIDTFINSIHLTSKPGRAGAITECRFGLASATFFDQVWVMDDASLSLAGTSTYFGFA